METGLGTMPSALPLIKVTVLEDCNAEQRALAHNAAFSVHRVPCACPHARNWAWSLLPSTVLTYRLTAIRPLAVLAQQGSHDPPQWLDHVVTNEPSCLSSGKK